jgi:hypothetical protein
MEACRSLAQLADPGGVLYETPPLGEPVDKTPPASTGNCYRSSCAATRPSLYPRSIGITTMRAPKRPQPTPPHLHDPLSTCLFPPRFALLWRILTAILLTPAATSVPASASAMGHYTLAVPAPARMWRREATARSHIHSQFTIRALWIFSQVRPGRLQISWRIDAAFSREGEHGAVFAHLRRQSY